MGQTRKLQESSATLSNDPHNQTGPVRKYPWQYPPQNSNDATHHHHSPGQGPQIRKGNIPIISISLSNTKLASTDCGGGGDIRSTVVSRHSDIEVAKVNLDLRSVSFRRGEYSLAMNLCNGALNTFLDNRLPPNHLYMKQTAYKLEQLKGIGMK
mmetsp:Transcript_29168/g.35550  ORF Transcript_29168/g.35550 Transcript_29168/m.35550 type:complete len:154 (+) Transcript_29168:1299-1760(+)